MISRANRSPLSEWWWTVDRAMLSLVLLMLLMGFVLSFAASPAVAHRIARPGRPRGRPRRRARGGVRGARRRLPDRQLQDVRAQGEAGRHGRRCQQRPAHPPRQLAWPSPGLGKGRCCADVWQSPDQGRGGREGIPRSTERPGCSDLWACFRFSRRNCSVRSMPSISPSQPSVSACFRRASRSSSNSLRRDSILGFT